jgi:trehalose 6-phosphate synthase/phosphatase
MTERILADGGTEPELAKSPSPIPGVEIASPDSSQHPGQRASVVNVPVTPGIHLGEYNSESSANSKHTPQSYFSHNITKLREGMAQSPKEAASGASSSSDILRRMSLTGGRPRAASIADLDPREANPALGLSGGIISATFCIPHSLQHRKGAEWVCGVCCG